GLAAARARPRRPPTSPGSGSSAAARAGADVPSPRRASAAFMASRSVRSRLGSSMPGTVPCGRMPAIDVSGLVVRYGDITAVADLSFSAEPGQVLALLGPNGAGKTTTVETLEGYRAPTAGAVRVLGLDPR